MKVGLIILALVLMTPLATAIDRAEVIDRAKAFCYHPWPCAQANLEAACLSNYDSLYTVGDHMGLPYDWGGYVSLHQFDLDLQAGQGAGSPPQGEVAACTTGLDCSGYVSQCWDTDYKYGTWTIEEISTPINVSDLLPGDALNYPGYHIELYGGTLANGTPFFYHALPPNVHINWYTGWAGVQDFDAIRYDQIGSAGSDLGSMSNPILISGWIYTDNRDTRQSPSDLLDACGAVPGTDESGPEFVYQFETTVPGTLLATVTVGGGVDIDLHLYQNLAERDCIARHDHTLEIQLDACGTYYLVLDTWVSADGTEHPGAYTLTADFTPTGGSCQAMPNYDFLGGPGQACAYPDHSDLYYCNPGLGATTCLYTSGIDAFSFCTYPCADDADCIEDFPGGCCLDIGDHEFFCVIEDLCPVDDDGGTDGSADAGSDPGWDAGSDPGWDAGSDPGWDAGSDPGRDAGSDPGWDAGADPGRDAFADATVDAGSSTDDQTLNDNQPSCGCSSNSTFGSVLPVLLLLLGWLRAGRSDIRRRLTLNTRHDKKKP
ncbi:MAG: hypothetical protein JRJ87_08075 [Deltaproteobacteria bacterium]|nr:hypothetical protein [Deltaproteobacteria bacterium]